MNDFWKKRLGSDDEYKREELIKKIVDVIEHMSIEELEALAYGMSTKRLLRNYNLIDTGAYI